MWSKISNSKAAYMVLAIVCSIALWLYVDIVEAPKSTTTVSNIPVTFVGEDALEQEGLMIVDGSEITVSLKLEGPRSAISQVKLLFRLPPRSPAKGIIRSTMIPVCRAQCPII